MRVLAVLIVLLPACAPLWATVTISSAIGPLRDSTGEALDSSHPTIEKTLWALVVDDGDDMFPGGLGLNESLEDIIDNAEAHAAFAGIEISNGLTFGGGGDKIFAIGEVDAGTGFSLPFLSELDLDANNLSPGAEYALYWFPGLDLGNRQLPADDPFEIGGINEMAAFDPLISSPLGMEIPNDGETANTNILDTSFGGTLPTSRFSAIVAIPEPSTALLGLLGLGLGLARRRC